MLKFVWKADHAGAPDSKAYADAQDELFHRDDSETDIKLQGFAKAQDGWHGVEAPLTDRIQAWLDEGSHGRVVIMVHGFAFDPDDTERAVFDDNPYNGVFRDVDDINSWLPIVGSDKAVGFAWTSLPSLGEAAEACWTNFYEYAVQDVAVLAAKALAAIIAAFHAKGVTVDLLAHSLGTRVSSKALAWLRDQAGITGAVRRVLMLGGAEYSIDALADTRGVGAEVFNFASRRDWVLKWGASQLGGKQRVPNTMASRVIGRDGLKRADHWIDFQLDHSDPDNAEEFRAWFDDLGGYKLSGRATEGRGIHWAYYLHRGNRALLTDILENQAITIAWMRGQSAPDGIDRFRYQELSGTPPKTPTTCRNRHRLYDRPR